MMAQDPPYGYPTGHQNHLDDGQSQALIAFKELCQQDGLYTPATETVKASHEDETLLRFLRARKFVPKDALRQFKETEKWREEQKIEEWYDTIDVDEYEATRLLYTHWTGRRDKRGIPLYVFRIGDLESKKISEAESSGGKGRAKGSLSPKLRRLFATYEHLTQFVCTLCSKVEAGRAYPETPISQTCNIVDISGVSLTQFWSLKSHLQDASVLATAHYPETLGRTFVVGAPAFFPTAWNYLKPWFDPITVAKVFILPASQAKPTLERYIDPQNLPKRYGGTLDWEFSSDPDLDPEVLEVLKMDGGATTLPKGPIRWKHSGDGSRVDAHAVGTIRGAQRDEVVGYIPSDIFDREPSRKE